MGSNEFITTHFSPRPMEDAMTADIAGLEELQSSFVEQLSLSSNLRKQARILLEQAGTGNAVITDGSATCSDASARPIWQAIDVFIF